MSMRPIRKHLTYANVMATIAVFGVLGGGAAYAADTIGSSDIINGQVKSVDIGNNQIQSVDIKDGTLNDEDVGQGTFVNFTGTIGNVPAHGCVEQVVSGVNAQGDHLLLTPNFETQSAGLVYSAEYSAGTGSMLIQACNDTGGPIDDGTTNFNLLVIDAQ